MNYKNLISLGLFLCIFLIYNTYAAAPVLDTISITSNNANPSFAKEGDTVTLSFTAESPITNVSVTLLGHVATVSNTFGDNWEATTTVQSGDTEGLVTFIIDYQDSDPPNDVGQEIAVRDASSVTVDLTPPALTSVTPISDPTNDQTPNYTLSSLENVTLTYGGSCSSTTSSVASGNNTIIFDTLSEGTYNDCVITATDNAGNIGIPLSIPTFMVDITRPVITEITPVSIFTADQTPDYTFNTTEAGSIVYGGACGSFTATAVVGDNTVTFNPLGSGLYSNCILIVTDAAGNSSSTFNISDFTVDAVAPVFQNIGVSSNNSLDTSLAKEGDVLTFTLTLNIADTSAGGTITFSIGSTTGLTVSLSAGDTTKTNYTTAYTVLDGQNGIVQITDITFADNVNNTLTGFTAPQVPSPTVTIDTILPTLDAASVSTNGNPGWAKGGQWVNYSLTFSENITGTVNSASTADNASVLVQDIDVNDGTADTIIFQVDSGNNGTIAPNNIDFTITDSSGNATPINDLGTVSGTAIIADTISPNLGPVSITSNNAEPTKAKTNDTITVNFTSLETIVNVSGTIFGEPGVITNLGGNNWSLSLMTDGNETEGNAPFTLNFDDPAGNIGLQVSSTNDGSAVDFDITNPMVSNVTIISDNSYAADAPTYYARVGDTMSLSFSSSEPIQTPIGTMLGKTPTFSNTGNNWTVSVMVENTDLEGTIPLDLEIYDVAGNDNLQITTTMNGTSVLLDRTAPTVPTLIEDLLGSSTSNFKHRSNAEYSFSGQQDLQSDGVSAGSGLYQYEVRFENTDNGTDESQTLNGGDNTFIPQLPLPNDNPYRVLMNVVDKAGNQSGETLLYSQKYAIGLSGVVTNSTGTPLKRVVVQAIARYGEECDTNQEVCSDITDEQGQYAIILKKDRNYNTVYFNEYYYLAREDIRVNQTDVEKDITLTGIESLKQVQTADKMIRIVTNKTYTFQDQIFNTEIVVSSLSGQISVTTNADEHYFTVTSLSRMVSVSSIDTDVEITDNGDNTFTIRNGGMPINLDSLDRNDNTDIPNPTTEGTSTSHASGASRIGVKTIAASGKAANRAAGQSRGNFMIQASDFISEAESMLEASELAYQASLEQVEKINAGVPAKVTTYADHKGREIFAGYLSGKLPMDQIKRVVPVRYGSRGLTPERSIQRPRRSAALKDIIKEGEVLESEIGKENIGCIKRVRKKRDFRFECE